MCERSKTKSEKSGSRALENAIVRGLDVDAAALDAEEDATTRWSAGR